MGRMLRRLLLLLPLVLLIAAPSAHAQEAAILETASERLKSEPLYVHPDVRSELDEAQARRLREAIDDLGGPMYVAVLPAEAIDQGGGTARGAIVQLATKVGRRGIFAMAVPGGDLQLIAGSNLGAGDSRVAEAADAALAAHPADGVSPVLTDFIARVDDLAAAEAGGARSSGDTAGAGGSGDGGGFGVTALILIGGGALAVAGILFARRERRRVQGTAFQEAKDNARDDLVALGDDIRSLDLDVAAPGIRPPAIDDYAVAVSAYERADRAWKASRTPADLEPVSMALEEGRWAMSSAKARLEEREPPLRRAPCFFDPRHGPSSRTVDWKPPYGAARAVPACEADARRVEQGDEPQAREVLVGGRKTPYWNAGPAYGPFAGGFFGGAAAGLLPSLLVGSMLGMSLAGTMGADDAFGADGSAAGGDFGGGDFGGGGFSGGSDFGGGSF